MRISCIGNGISTLDDIVPPKVGFQCFQRISIEVRKYSMFCKYALQRLYIWLELGPLMTNLKPFKYVITYLSHCSAWGSFFVSFEKYNVHQRRHIKMAVTEIERNLFCSGLYCFDQLGLEL